jgi:hypothetical protein
MMSSGKKRCYVHHKKFLNESLTQIKNTLEFIRVIRKDPGSPEESQRKALAHAQSIEAVCWSPHSHISTDIYQRIMAAKTQELCCMLLRNALFTVDVTQLCHFDPRVARQPVQPPLLVPVFLAQGSRLENGWPGFPTLDLESIGAFGSEPRDVYAGLGPFEGGGADLESYFEGGSHTRS